MLSSKEIHLSKRALAKNLKEMQEPNAAYPIERKRQRPFLLRNSPFLEDLCENKGVCEGVHKVEAKKILAEWSRDYKRFARKNNLGRIEVLTEEIKQLDKQLESALLSGDLNEVKHLNVQAKPLREERYKLSEKMIEYLDKPKETFYKKKMLRRIVDREFKPRQGYSIRLPDPTDESLFHIK